MRIRVPLADVVASRWPDGATDIVLSAESCATMMDTGCFLANGAGDAGCAEDGGPNGSEGGHGGRWTSCTCPNCRPGMASSVECVAVAIASRPAEDTGCRVST